MRSRTILYWTSTAILSFALLSGGAVHIAQRPEAVEGIDPDVVLRADGAAVSMGASKEVRGAAAVAETVKGRAQFARPALVDGAAGAVWAPGGQPRVAFAFTIERERIVAIELRADPARFVSPDLVLLDE